MKEYRPRLTPYLNTIIQGIKYKPVNYKKYILLPDVHRPFHNQVLWDKVMNLCREMRSVLDGVVITGDFGDFFTLGSYNAESLGSLQGITLEEEYADCAQGIYEINNALPDAKEKYYIYGNHEDRYFREIKKKDNAKYGGALLHPDKALRLQDTGWIVKHDWKEDYVKLGNHLQIFHGIYTNKHSANKHLEVFGSCVFGHTHRFDIMNNGMKAAYNIGWMGDRNSKYFKYMPRGERGRWINGFAFVTIDDKGMFHVDPIRVNEDNTFTFNSVIF